MDTADRLELHELAARYGDAIDARDWPALAGIFTPDAVLDFSAFNDGPVLRGLDAIQSHLAGYDDHPLTHLISNVYATEDAAGEVLLHSRILALLPERSPGAGWYVDRVANVDGRWLITWRTFTPVRRRPGAPLIPPVETGAARRAAGPGSA